MALSKDQKNKVVKDTAELLEASKMTVLAQYKGISVKSIQALRKSAKDNRTTVKVIKNRLVIQALKQVEALQNVDTTGLKDQLLYAFNDQDEVASAQALNTFAKTETNLVFVGAISADGNMLTSEDVIALASLPSKDQLRGQLIGTISAPLSGFVSVLNGNLKGLLNVLNAKADLG